MRLIFRTTTGLKECQTSSRRFESPACQHTSTNHRENSEEINFLSELRTPTDGSDCNVNAVPQGNALPHTKNITPSNNFCYP